MSVSREDMDRIEQFLEGTLPQRDRALFSRRLASEPDLAQAVEEHRELLQAITQSGRNELKARLENIGTGLSGDFEPYSPSETPPKKGPSKPKSGGFLGGLLKWIIVLAIGGGAYWAYHHFGLEEQYHLEEQVRSLLEQKTEPQNSNICCEVIGKHGASLLERRDRGLWRAFSNTNCC